MGILDHILGRLIYLDTNVFIYALEGFPAFARSLAELFQALDRGALRAVTSELTLAETLVKPFADGSVERQRAYEEAIRDSAQLRVISIDRAILVDAARLRAQTGLKLPDAMHASTALQTACTTFVTNDHRFRLLTDIRVIVLSEIGTEPGGNL